jgi:hypothetical protein
MYFLYILGPELCVLFFSLFGIEYFALYIHRTHKLGSVDGGKENGRLFGIFTFNCMK